MVVVGLALVTVGSSARVPAAARVFGWCRHLVAVAVPPWLGLAATAGLAVICGTAGRTWRIHQQLRAQPGDEPILVVPLESAVAYSLPGTPGQIVVSSGMLSRLDPDERRVLFADEQSHLRHRHHRYLLIADLAAAVPLLRPLRNQVRFAVERWADEDAAAQVGNRELVARTLARAALAQSDGAPAAALAAAGGGVPQRVEALLAGKRASGGRTGFLLPFSASLPRWRPDARARPRPTHFRLRHASLPLLNRGSQHPSASVSSP
jgi:Peptidase family M48